MPARNCNNLKSTGREPIIKSLQRRLQWKQESAITFKAWKSFWAYYDSESGRLTWYRYLAISDRPGDTIFLLGAGFHVVALLSAYFGVRPGRESLDISRQRHRIGFRSESPYILLLESSFPAPVLVSVPVNFKL